MQKLSGILWILTGNLGTWAHINSNALKDHLLKAVQLTPSASSKSGTGFPLQFETTILSPTADVVTKKLSEIRVMEHNMCFCLRKVVLVGKKISFK